METLSVADKFFRDKLCELIKSLKLNDEVVECEVLGADRIRLPSQEYALMKGKEVIVSCKLRSWFGQAFTDEPKPFKGKLSDVAELPLTSSGNRAIFFAVLNMLMQASGEIEGVVHCRGEDADRCGEMLAKHIKDRFGDVKVLHIGFQPSHVKALTSTFKNVFVTDLNPDNVGNIKFGLKILDGSINEDLIDDVDVVYITGSTIVNGTLFPLLEKCKKLNKQHILYGITAKGAAKLLGCEVFCPYGRNSLDE